MQQSALTRQIVRLAHERLDLRPHLLPLLRQARELTAARDTMDFVTWALLTQDPIPTDRVIKFLERQGVELELDTSTKHGQLLQRGELVQVQASNAPSDLRDLLQPYDLRKGVVDEVDGKDIVIKFQGRGDLLRVPGGVTSGKTSGVYRTSQVDEQNRKHLEFVYLPANERPPSSVAVQVVRKYVENGLAKGEERSENYFSGFVANYKISKSKDPYFLLWTQQRLGAPRSLSPNKGHVYYAGIVGQRPGGWQGALDDILSVGDVAVAG